MRYVAEAEFGSLNIEGARAGRTTATDLVGNLVAAAVPGGWRRILTGVNMGPVGVEVEVLEREPVESPDPMWEDVAELSVMVGPEGGVRVRPDGSAT